MQVGKEAAKVSEMSGCARQRAGPIGKRIKLQLNTRAYYWHLVAASGGCRRGIGGREKNEWT